jgi:hypothetical protein
MSNYNEELIKIFKSKSNEIINAFRTLQNLFDRMITVEIKPFILKSSNK